MIMREYLEDNPRNIFEGIPEETPKNSMRFSKVILEETSEEIRQETPGGKSEKKKS